VDEGADTPPGNPGDAVDCFLVMIDAVFPSRLQRVKTRKSKAKWTTVWLVRVVMVAVLRKSTHMRPLIVPIRTRTIPVLPVHPWSTPVSSRFEQSDIRAGFGLTHALTRNR
jgi:hypothetical protein